MRSAICPGSFDPVTHGHLDIIRRAAAMFDQVTVVVMTNSQKVPAFTREERVISCGGHRRPAQCRGGRLRRPVGGIRPPQGGQRDRQRPARMSDFEYEFQMALTNRKLNPLVETVFLTTTAEHMYLSSSLVKQVASLGGDITGFVPACILPDILQKIGGTRKD